uniref:2-C-methyl-D-erythritol 4-phosphate cytidylyltransferase, chloroplastic n=1 Tax=Chromera velia CCMP2878 TaxID=1169474 RepID=A0A0G4G981_9ALVE|eukprot:Cvel_20751.t1-p1 / transcript=Cvel_20751.t1 / gene=Cvel_20751 / organism=Chromera_velia_CCMP2878 / gene_product=2-C-methyl-D-erythritol 4-phosphate, putative / transcript_product=2-C-methyl-D-erythritol 4-phosphate, putative / location=Cvel_scaffold1891:1289-4084(+) / protein_length=320 / sequence_SO=supercontig / SO=protein_coding / is_pseudo=false
MMEVLRLLLAVSCLHLVKCLSLSSQHQGRHACFIGSASGHQSLSLPLAALSQKTLRPSRNSVAVASSSSGIETQNDRETAVQNVAVILLAGGVGSRMGANMPKQFLLLRKKPILRYSMELFLSLPFVSHLVLVIAPQYRDEYRLVYEEIAKSREGFHVPELRFADPGKERQNSVSNGMDAAPPECSLLAVHDSARPLVTPEEVEAVVRDAFQHGAAVLGVPMKATVKESEDGQFVVRTIPRQRLWEIHTPQVVKPDVLRRGFAHVEKNRLEVTDDVSVVEALGEPVKLTKGQYTNLKVTTPEDLDAATAILESREALRAA